MLTAVQEAKAWATWSHTVDMLTGCTGDQGLGHLVHTVGMLTGCTGGQGLGYLVHTVDMLTAAQEAKAWATWSIL